MLFFQRGIHMLPERWEKVIASDSNTFSDMFFTTVLNKELIFTKKQRELIPIDYIDITYITHLL